MPRIPIIMPQLGESIAEATVVNLLVKPGEAVQADQDVLEVETNKATMNVTAPAAGSLEKFAVKLNESYPVGAVLGYLQVSNEEAVRAGLDELQPVPEKHTQNGGGSPTAERRAPRVEPTVRGLPVPAHALGASYMSPRMKARMQEL